MLQCAAINCCVGQYWVLRSPLNVKAVPLVYNFGLHFHNLYLWYKIISSHMEQEQEIYFLSRISRLALGSTKLPIQWVKGVFFSGWEADHALPFSAKVKNEWRYISSPLYAFMAYIGLTLPFPVFTLPCGLCQFLNFFSGYYGLLINFTHQHEYYILGMK